MAVTEYAVHTERQVLAPAAFMDFRYEVNRRLQGGATQARILGGRRVSSRTPALRQSLAVLRELLRVKPRRKFDGVTVLWPMRLWKLLVPVLEG